MRKFLSILASVALAAHSFAGISPSQSSVTAAIAAANDGDTISLNANWPLTAGTFTLTFNGQTTSGLAYNASASTVQTALNGLSSIGANNSTVVLGSSGDYLVTFNGLAGAQPLITGSGASLTPANEIAAATIQKGLSGTVTISIASPAVITGLGSTQGLAVKDPVYFTTTGALPTGISPNTTYYVTSVTTNTFTISATQGGSNINTSGTQSGTHTCRKNAIQAVSIGANWSSTVSVNIGKNIFLQGAGGSMDSVSTGTRITGSGTGGALFSYNAVPTDTTARLSSLWFDSLLSNANSIVAFNGVSTVHTVGGIAAGGVRMDHCHFTVDDDSQIGFILHFGGYLTGVVDHNYFDYDLNVAGGDGEIIENGQTNTPITLSAAPLTVGKLYQIVIFGAGDDFTNVGANSNVLGASFTAKGTTPTTWTHGSVVNEIVSSAGAGQYSYFHGYQFGQDYTVNGNSDALYYEDNIFHKNGFVIDSSLGGGAYVSRHNLSWGSMGSHGMETGNNLGPFGIEWYNNLFIGHAATTYNMHNVRGGGVICFNTRAIDISKPDIAPGFYRVTSTGSGVVGNGDGTNWFDRNYNETYTGAGGAPDGSISTYLNALPLSPQFGQGNSYTPINESASQNDSRVGTPYFKSIANNVVTATTTSGLNTFTVTAGSISSADIGRPVTGTNVPSPVTGFDKVPLTLTAVFGSTGTMSGNATGTGSTTLTLGSIVRQGLSGQANAIWLVIGLGSPSDKADKWFGFTLRDATTSPAANLGSQVPSNPASTATLILHSTATSTGTLLTCGVGQGNSTGWTALGPDALDIRYIKQPLNVPGSGVMDSLISGDLKLNPAPSFITGSGLPQRWCNQAGFGLWQQCNEFKNTGDPGYTLFNHLSATLYASLVPGGTHDSDTYDPTKLPSGYPNTAKPGSPSAPQIADLKIGPDWSVTNIVDTPASIPYTDPDGATFYGGAVYPHPLVSGGAAPSTKVVRLTGTMTFGGVNTGSTSASTLTIHNDGNATLTLHNGSPNGVVYPTGYSGATENGVTIASGQSIDVPVTFSPLLVQDYPGTITVNSDATSGTNTIAVDGQGTSPSTRVISITGSLEFNKVQRGFPKTKQIFLSNTGNTPFHVSGITDSNSLFTYDWTNGTINPGQTQTVNVTCSPSTTGAQTTVVTVATDSTSPTVSGTKTMNGSVTGKIYFPYL